MEERFEALPETFNEMMLFPNVPNFSASHRDFAKVHQIKDAGSTLIKKEKCDCTKGWMVSLDSTRRHINPPSGIMPYECFFPLRGILLLPLNRESIVAFACNDDLGKPSTMPPFSQRLRDEPGVHGQGNLRQINTLTGEFIFQA